MSDPSASLYERLSGYDAIAAVADNLLPRLMADEQLGRFWEHRGADGIAREKQLLVDFLCHNARADLCTTQAAAWSTPTVECELASRIGSGSLVICKTP